MLTPEDAAAVLQRAAELDTPSLEQHDALDEQVVRAAAREVGLSEGAVEQAVQEWRAGVLAPLPPLSPDRWAGLPGSVVVERLLPLPPDEVTGRLDAWLRGQWFERRAARGSETDWTPRRGPLAGARRAADLDHRLRLRRTGRLRVCVAPAAQGSRVRLVADVGDTRAAALAGWVGGPAAVAGAGAAVVLHAPVAELLVALPAAVGAGGLGWFGARRTLDSARTTLHEVLETALTDLVLAPSRRPLAERATAWALGRLPRGLRGD